METNEKVKIHILFYGNDENIEKAFPYFSDLRRQKFSRIINPKARLQQAAAELAVCAAMKSENFPFAPPEYDYEASGRPSVKNGFMSISHTKNAAACVLFSKPIGLDIEFFRPVNPLLAGKILNCREFPEFTEATEKNEFLLKNWTAKESLFKFTGQGLKGGMKNADFSIGRSVITTERGKSFYIFQKRFFNTFNKSNPDVSDVKGGYFLALCAEAPINVEFAVYGAFNAVIDFLKGTD